MSNLREKELQEERDKALSLKLQAEYDREFQNTESRNDENKILKDGKSPVLVECTGCHVKNRVPTIAADAFLCGACNKELKGAGLLLQKEKVESETYITLQVQCGHCNVINEVQVLSGSQSVQFKCGSCESINEAEVQ